MNRIAKALVVSAAVAATAAVPLASSAQARDWHHHHHGNNGVALGVLGLATGAIIGGAIASSPRYYDEPPVGYGYYAPPPPRVVYRTYEPAPVYAGGLRPWTRSWYRYCSDRYRSFDPRSGTFVGFDGRSHFCVAD